MPLQRPTKLIDLPTEILCKIITSVPETLTCFALMQTCKRVHSLFSPTTIHGMRLWRALRRHERWPDPASIAMSDYTFLRSIHGRGCNSCANHPLLRSPIWEFDGIRLCKECLETLTIRDYELDIPVERYNHLICTVTSGYTRGMGGWTYRSYLRDTIPSEMPTEEEQHLGRLHIAAVRRFILAVKDRQADLKQEHERLKASLKRRREADVDTFLSARMPNLHNQFYCILPSYQAAIDKTTPFTARSQAIFLKKAKLDTTTFRHQLIRDHVDLYAHMEFVEHDGSFIETLRQLPQYTGTIAELMNDNDAATDLPSKARIIAALTPLRPIVELAIAKQRTQRRWLGKHGNVHINERLKLSDLYKEADASREDDFKHLADSCKAERTATGKILYYCMRCRYCSRRGASTSEILHHVATSAACTIDNVGQQA